MSMRKSFFLSKMLLLLFIAVVNIGGCGALGGDGCGNSCSGGLFCPTSREECKCVSERKDCNKFSFNEKTGKCKISGCSVCGLLIGRCGESETSQEDLILSESEFVTVLPLEQGCEVIASTYSENVCENIAIDRECESFEFMPSEEYMFPNECWLYDCQKCLLEMD